MHHYLCYGITGPMTLSLKKISFLPYRQIFLPLNLIFRFVPSTINFNFRRFDKAHIGAVSVALHRLAGILEQDGTK